MSLDAIKKSIIEDASSRSSQIEGDASKEARRILNEAEEKAREITRRAEAEAKAEAERILKEAMEGAGIEADSILLDARNEAVERSLKHVLFELEDRLRKGEMKRILDMGIKQFREISDGDLTIRTSKKYADTVGKSQYKVEYGDVDGFMLYSQEGKVALNATIGSITSNESENARKLIADHLFGAKGHHAKKGASHASAKKPARHHAKGKKR